MLLVPRKPGGLNAQSPTCMPRAVEKELVSLTSPATISTESKGERKTCCGLTALRFVLDLVSLGGEVFSAGPQLPCLTLGDTFSLPLFCKLKLEYQTIWSCVRSAIKHQFLLTKAQVPSLLLRFCCDINSKKCPQQHSASPATPTDFK